MLTLAPHHRDDSEIAMAVVRWRQQFHFEWARFLLGLCAGFHLWMAATVAFAPEVQIVNRGTEPVFDLAPRAVWAVAYLVGGIGALSLLKWHRTVTQLLTWFTVFPLASTWTAALVIAVINGKGSAIGVVVWSVLTLLWATVAIRLALGKR